MSMHDRPLQHQPEGLSVAVLGGGHGLATLLRGLKEYATDLTAIVTVADDGGSSGQLRRELGVLPPGDFRNCLTALADSESLMTRLFQYRFGEGTGLGGHSFGNLFITAMAEISGSFVRGLAESSRVLAVQGRVLPSTLQDVTLVAHLREEQDGTLNRVAGESRIPQANGTIERVFLEPDKVPAYPDAVRAILNADLILAGPGSLYTSVLPNLLVPGIAEAVRASRAVKVYVCNVATQQGETDNYTVADHSAALDGHLGSGVFSIVLANDNLEAGRDLPQGVEMVALENWVHSSNEKSLASVPSAGKPSSRLVTADLVDPVCPWRHDPVQLSRAILSVYQVERVGELSASTRVGNPQ
jgi:uncharacterized cofD-like protein